MKNKGFTLVELLAVVVLFGLLIVLVATKVRPAINDSKENVSFASATNLVGALEKYYFEVKLKGEFNGCIYNFTTDSNSCVGFSFTGSKPTGGEISLSSTGVIEGNLVFDDFTFPVENNIVMYDLDN